MADYMLQDMDITSDPNMYTDTNGVYTDTTSKYDQYQGTPWYDRLIDIGASIIDSSILPWGLEALDAYQIYNTLDDSKKDIKSGYDQARTDITGAYKPYVDFGLKSLDRYNALGNFKFDYNNYLNSDNYNWLRNEGMRDVYRNAAAKKMLSSGNTLAALNERNNQLARSAYDEEFNRQLEGYNTNKDYAGFGVGVGAEAAGKMGTNLADLAVGRGQSLALNDIAKATMFSNLLQDIGAKLTQSANKGKTSSTGDKIIGAIKSAAGDLLDVDTAGNILDSITGEVLGNLDEVTNWMGDFGKIDAKTLFDPITGKVNYSGLFTPTTSNGFNAMFGDIAGGGSFDWAGATFNADGTVNYGDMFKMTADDPSAALDIANTMVEDQSWWDSFSSDIAEGWNDLTDFFSGGEDTGTAASAETSGAGMGTAIFDMAWGGLVSWVGVNLVMGLIYGGKRTPDYQVLAQRVFTTGSGDPFENILSKNYTRENTFFSGDDYDTGSLPAIFKSYGDLSNKEVEKAVPALVTSIVNKAPMSYINSSPEYRKLAEDSVYKQLTKPYWEYSAKDYNVEMAYNQDEILSAANKLWGVDLDKDLFNKVMEAKKEIQKVQNATKSYTDNVLPGDYGMRTTSYTDSANQTLTDTMNKYKPLLAQWNTYLSNTLNYKQPVKTTATATTTKTTSTPTGSLWGGMDATFR